MSVTTFGLAANTIKTTLASAHSVSDGQLVLAAGSVAAIGALPAHRVYRVVAVASPGTASEVILAIFEATGATGDTLTGLSAVEGTSDVHLASGTAIRVRDTARYFTELQSAINTLEAGAGSSMGIGNAITSATAGMTLYVGASGTLQQAYVGPGLLLEPFGPTSVLTTGGGSGLWHWIPPTTVAQGSADSTTDTSYQTLDLSAFLPPGATAVKLCVYLYTGSPQNPRGLYLRAKGWRTTGFINTDGSVGCAPCGSGVYVPFFVELPVSPDRAIEYLRIFQVNFNWAIDVLGWQ